MFSWFESRINPTKLTKVRQPPERLWQFYWHYVKQVWPWIAMSMVVGLIATIIEVSLFQFLGRIIDEAGAAVDPGLFIEQHAYLLLGMTVAVLVFRPLILALWNLLINQTLVPGFTNLIRWQNHRYILRQSLSFFQNDFAGRIANKIMQTGPAMRESVLDLTDSLWFVTIYTSTAIYLFFQSDPRLALPLLLWTVVYIALLWFFVPRVRDAAKEMSEARSTLTGRIVDSYTNIQTVKLFAPHETAMSGPEEAYAKEAIDHHTKQFAEQMRLLTLLETAITIINGLLIVITGSLAISLWSSGAISIGAIALTMGLVLRINNMSDWVMWVVTSIFENIGTAMEGMETISKPSDLVDSPDARALKVSQGAVRFENVSFTYSKESRIIRALDLEIKPGEKIGLVGPSGAGKSTLISLLLRFYDLDHGRILIDDQDIAEVTQTSLRSQISMVTQDTSLLHRSIFANITYGSPGASLDDAIWAATAANAIGFIPNLVDADGRSGFEAHVGERGVKLSGGQRQRIALARVLLKNAPILVLDEATSALDSQIEADIQDQLKKLMEGKTVIAIAHRLSTIAQMDRLVVLNEGQIIEIGGHSELLGQNGLYAELWKLQSGGFIGLQKEDSDVFNRAL